MIDFDDDELPRALDRLSVEERDALPFGLIGLDPEGNVRFYSETEARLSGMGTPPRIGAAFFREIAPCMDTPSFRGRIEEALARGQLDVEIGHTGDFADRKRFIRVRAMSAADGGIWLAMRREGRDRTVA
jgi:photoactive yellow protein